MRSAASAAASTPPMAASRARWLVTASRTGRGGKAAPALLKWRTLATPGVSDLSHGTSSVVMTASSSSRPARQGGRPSPSLDHSIGPQQHRRRDGKAERLRGLQVEDQLERRGLLDGEIRRLGAVEDLVHQTRRLASELTVGRGVGGQSATFREKRSVEHGRQPLLLRRVQDEPGNVQRDEPRREDAVRVTFSNLRERRLRFLFGPQRSLDEREAQAPRRVPIRRQLRDDIGVRRVIGQEHALEPGHQLAEDLHPLRAEVDVQISRPGDVAARARQALHQADSNGITAAHEDDRDLLCRRLRGLRRVAAFARHDDVDAPPDEITRGLGKLRRVALREAHADHELLVLTVAKLEQAVAQTDDRGCRPPGFGQRADLDQPRRRRPGGTPCLRNRDDADGYREPAKPAAAHRLSGWGADSARRASMMARDAGLIHSRGPTASATARPSRATRKVVGRPTTPYAALILPSGSRTRAKVRSRSFAYRRTASRSSRALIPTTARPRPANSRWSRSSIGISGRHSRHQLAQKLTISTFPRRSAIESCRASCVRPLKSGG